MTYDIIITFSGTPEEGSHDLFDITLPQSIFTPIIPTSGIASLAASSGDDAALLNTGVRATGNENGISALDEDSIDLLANPGDLPVTENPAALFDIQGVYNLFVSADAGGSVSGTPSDRYLPGSPINITATPIPGYHFVGWTLITTSSLMTPSSNPAVFDMPDARVSLIATFEPDVPPTPDNPSGGGGTQGGSGSPQTGDRALGVFVVVGLMAALGTTLVLLGRKSVRRSMGRKTAR